MTSPARNAACAGSTTGGGEGAADVCWKSRRWDQPRSSEGGLSAVAEEVLPWDPPKEGGVSPRAAETEVDARGVETLAVIAEVAERCREDLVGAGGQILEMEMEAAPSLKLPLEGMPFCTPASSSRQAASEWSGSVSQARKFQDPRNDSTPRRSAREWLESASHEGKFYYTIHRGKPRDRCGEGGCVGVRLHATAPGVVRVHSIRPRGVVGMQNEAADHVRHSLRECDIVRSVNGRRDEEGMRWELRHAMLLVLEVERDELFLRRDLECAWVATAAYDACEPEGGYMEFLPGDWLEPYLATEAPGAAGNQYESYMYARALDGSGREGWVPACMLRPLMRERA